MVSAGFTHTCAITTAGAAFCWGSNTRGELGDGYFTGMSLTVNRLTPAPVFGGLVFANVSAGMVYTCGVTTAGTGYCWGDNTQGQVGNNSGPIPATGDYRRAPQVVMTTYSFASISAGINHSCGVTPWSYNGNVLLCWGNNYHGQLGDGTWDTRTTPVVSRGY
jgi:alpha-tubulin suppressor-like RCC1 family protein